MSSSPSSSLVTPARAGRIAPCASETHVRVTALLVALAWAEVLWCASPGLHSRASRGVLTLAGLAAQLVFSVLEGFAAAVVWRATGARVGAWALATRVLAASAAEAFAVAILAGTIALPQHLAVVLCGPRAWPAWVPASGLERAFAGTGLLLGVRLVLSASAQARRAGATFGRGLAVVGSLHVAARLALWWGSELVLGRSPVS